MGGGAESPVPLVTLIIPIQWVVLPVRSGVRDGSWDNTEILIWFAQLSSTMIIYIYKGAKNRPHLI